MSVKENLEIIIITHNKKTFLEKTLIQIFSGPLKNCLITVLDNASTDETQHFCQGITEYNFRYIRNARNLGVSGNIIKAMEIAQSKYVWFMGDDDSYDWSVWPEIETAIEHDYDMINVYNRTDLPKADSQDLIYFNSYLNSFFLSGTIYKTKFIDYNSIRFAYYLSQTLNPFNILSASIINQKGKIYLPTNNLIIQNMEKNYAPYVISNDNIPEIFSRYNYLYETLILFSLIKDIHIRNSLYSTIINDDNLKCFFDIGIDKARLAYIFMMLPVQHRKKMLRYLFKRKQHELKDKWVHFFEKTLER